jgi:predicted acetyltransferase
MIEIQKTAFDEVKNLRLEYLNSIYEFQELYLELMVQESDYYFLLINSEIAGYVIVKTDENKIIEFYLKKGFIVGAQKFFEKVCWELKIAKVYCKSFDSLLLDCCLVNSSIYKIEGVLFRDIVEDKSFYTNELSTRLATQHDLPFLLEQKEGLFETKEELERFIDAKNITLFEKDESLVGCGFLIKIHHDFNYYDIGMWVNPDFRKLGYATQIISYLKEFCLKNGFIPICGCAFENIASRKTLEKNGFISKHKLIEFYLKKL